MALPASSTASDQHSHDAAPTHGVTPEASSQTSMSETLRLADRAGFTAADLTSCVRTTHGSRPPALVGSSITLVGDDDVYVFGGRLVSKRTMLNEMWRLSLSRRRWEKVWPKPSSQANEAPAPSSPRPAPLPRYFHSACAWGHRLVIFGGETYEEPTPASVADVDPPAEQPSHALKTLRDVAIFDTRERCWLDVPVSSAAGVEPPAARFAHLAAVTLGPRPPCTGFESEDALMTIMGGQDVSNNYLHSTHTLNLDTLTWIASAPLNMQVGTYRAALAFATPGARSRRPSPRLSSAPLRQVHGHSPTTSAATMEGDGMDGTDQLVLFANSNFSAPRRELHLFPSPTSRTASSSASVELSPKVSQTVTPPGLRFVDSAMVGSTLVIFGISLASPNDSFAVWALDLGPDDPARLFASASAGDKWCWRKVEAGRALGFGSWNRALVAGNTLVVLGDVERDLREDYDQRRTNFRDLAFVDLEAFGIYCTSLSAVPGTPENALANAILADPTMCDVEIICSDGITLSASQLLLSRRCPEILRISSAQQPSSIAAPAQNAGPTADLTASQSSTEILAVHVSELSPTVEDLLKYCYMGGLPQACLQDVRRLVALLRFACSLALKTLQLLCINELHALLIVQPQAAALVFEAAVLVQCHALQARSLQCMMELGGGAQVAATH